MEQLGLGVRLDFEDNMTNRINPLIRDLERLRRQAQQTTRTFDSMSSAYDPFSSTRRQKIREYHTSMQSLDHVLLNTSNSLIRATISANNLSRAMNRMQFTGNFNQMYGQIARVQRMLGNMGFGMSKMQREMSNLKAFNMMDVQIKDLQDRIKLTTKALDEMQKSPDSSKFVKEIDLAKRSLLAYRAELARTGSLQQKLADTHGLGTAKNFGTGKDILYEKPKSASEGLKNQMMGLAMSDMAVASTIAYNSLAKTSDMLTGLGYTSMEAKQKLTQLAGAMQTLGMTLTTTLSLVSAVAMGGWGYLAHGDEKAKAQFTGQTVMTTQQAKPYVTSMRQTYQDSSGADREGTARMYSTLHNAGIRNLGDMTTLSGGAWEIAYAQGTDAVETLKSAMSIASKTGSSYADSLDLLTLSLSENGGDLEASTQAVLENAGAFKDANGSWRQAFDTLNAGNKDGGINRLISGIKGLSNILVVLWEGGMKDVVGGLGDLISKMSTATTKFLEAHPAITKVVGSMLGLVLVVGMLAGPILVVTGFLLKFRSVIQGIALSVTALNKGGLALLGAQSNMVARNIHGATVAFARFPQTLMFAVLPAIYNITRAIPTLLWNMMKLNPAMTALSVGMLAYSKNWMGFKDTIDGVINKVKDSWTTAQGLVSSGLSGGEFDISANSNMEQIMAKAIGTAQVGKKVLGSIFGGEALKFSDGEQNLMKQLGIEGLVNGIAKAGKGIKDFWDGFMQGVEKTYNAVKTFVTWMWEAFEPVITFITDGILGIANAVSKMFGGKGGMTSINDIMESATGLNSTMKNLGLMAGVAVTSLLGFKLVKPLLDGLFKHMVKNPFGGIITSANNARRAIQGMSTVAGTTARNVASTVTRGAFGGTTTRTRDTRGRMSTSGQGGMGVFSRLGRDFGNANGRQAQADRNTLGVRHADYQAMSANQRNNHNRRLTNERARARGYDIDNMTSARQGRNNSNFINTRVAGQAGTQAGLSPYQRGQLRAIHEQGTVRGSTVYQRRQNVVSRALFGQAYDRFDEQGRRREVNRTGGLLRRRSADLNVTDRLGLGTRMSQGVVRQTDRARNAVTSGARAVVSRVSTATAGVRSAVGGAVSGATSKVVNSKAMKPITVPVRYVTERLKTAGVIRQGTQAGQQSGSRFKRAFNMATRTLGSGAKMFGGVVRGAGSAGRKAGTGMIKGMSFMGKGITGIFKLGLKAIPFLGWALMAWDIVSAVFTNWEAIKSGAQKAWEWIKTSGVQALSNAWDSIKEFAGNAWTWIKEDGLNTALMIAENFISFLGEAWTWIITKAIEAFAWILTDGIAMAVNLGAEFIKWIATDAFPKIVSFAGEVLTGFISTAGSIAVSIGKAMWDGITNALSGLGDWLGSQIAKVPGGSWVVEKLTGKKYARGGIINSPHMGIVGEAGPEAIIPLSGNQRDRARGLLEHTAGVLGMSVQKVGQGDASLGDDTFAELPTLKPNNTVVRANSGGNTPTQSGSEDNSITINNVHVNLPQGAQADSSSGRKIAQSLAKELQTLMKQERLRTKGKNLTLEELILNM